MNDDPTPLYLTGRLPRENWEGFYILLMWLKRQDIFVPKDIRKLLFEKIKLLKYNGCRLYKQGEIMTYGNLQADFLIMTAIDDDGAELTIDYHPIEIGHEPVFIFLRALDYTQIKLSYSDFSVASYSLNSDDTVADKSMNNILSHFEVLKSLPLHQLMNKKLVVYADGRLYIRHRQLSSVDSNWSVLDFFIHCGFISRGRPEW